VSDSLPPFRPPGSSDSNRKNRNRRGGRDRFRPQQPGSPPPAANAPSAREERDSDQPPRDLPKQSVRAISSGRPRGAAQGQAPGLPWLYAELHLAERQSVIDILATHGVIITDEMADDVIQAIDETISPGWAKKKFSEIGPLRAPRERTFEREDEEPDFEPEPEPIVSVIDVAAPIDDTDNLPVEPPDETPTAPRELTPEAKLLEEFLGKMEYPSAPPHKPIAPPKDKRPASRRPSGSKHPHAKKTPPKK
jgi:hypothetical protein